MDKEYVMKGNSAIMKCSVPSFVSDYVSVIGWVDETGAEYKSNDEYADSKKPTVNLVTPILILYSLRLKIVSCFLFQLFN